MTSATDLPVESGQGYTITDIDGHPPECLEDFTGDIHLTLARNGQLLHVTGSGASPTADSMRFYQKTSRCTIETSGSGPSPQLTTPHS